MSLIDVMQMGKGKKLKHPEVRVWFHPAHGGDDYARVYNSVDEAKEAIDTNRLMIKNGHDVDVAEPRPLVAYKGREYSINEFKKSKLRKLS